MILLITRQYTFITQHPTDDNLQKTMIQLFITTSLIPFRVNITHCYAYVGYMTERYRSSFFIKYSLTVLLLALRGIKTI
jgi:hypothetical protein